MTKVKNLFFPDFDYKQFVVECYMPAQTDPDKVRDNLLEMSALLKKNPAIERVAVSMGSAPARYCLVRPMTSGGDCYGELIVDCKDYETVVEQHILTHISGRANTTSRLQLRTPWKRNSPAPTLKCCVN